MADTLTLDTIMSWAVEQGASVRLIGDDQQLAAVGAGGVLRDIQTSQGASVLTELMRFTDPAEAAASLALRHGDASGLGFYLDTGRVHVGDLATMTDAAFGAWQSDTTAGLGSIMLAPTRELVGELNQRARTHRLARGGVPHGPEVLLADGNRASVGDTIITRVNDRRLRISRTDWVKNGDLWTVRDVTADGGLVAAHRSSGRLVRLPRDYVTTATELGYACTIHSAQGVSVDTMHGVCTGAESRQQFYTMMTRGRQANHVWLEVVPDPDPGVLTRPEGLNPPTPTDILEKILRRDQTQTSASSFLRKQSDPRVLLGQATARYLDGLGVAAAHHLGTAAVADLDARAEALLPGITDQHAWPTLHTHLLLLGTQGADPIGSLSDALDRRSIAGADDMAAVLSWRLDDTGLRNTTPGPLPWLPGIPTPLAADPTFGEWLTSQSARSPADHAGTPAGLPADRSAGLDADRRPPTRRRPARRDRGVAGRDAGRPRRPAPHRTTPDLAGSPHLAAPPRHPATPRARARNGRMGTVPGPPRPGCRPRPLHPRARRTPRRAVPQRPRRSPARPHRRRSRAAARRPRGRRVVVAHPPPASPARRRRPGACRARRVDLPAGVARRRPAGGAHHQQPAVAGAGRPGRRGAGPRLATVRPHPVARGWHRPARPLPVPAATRGDRHRLTRRTRTTRTRPRRNCPGVGSRQARRRRVGLVGRGRRRPARAGQAGPGVHGATRDHRGRPATPARTRRRLAHLPCQP